MIATRGMICEELFDCAAFASRNDCPDIVALLMKARRIIKEEGPVDSAIPTLQDAADLRGVRKLPFLQARIATLISALRRLSQ